VSATNLRVIHTVNSLRAEHGGPSRSITALGRAISARGVDTRIITHDDGPGLTQATSDSVRIEHLPQETVRELTSRRSAVGRRLAELARSGTILHDHGLWLPVNRAVASAAAMHAIPRVVSIRGMLSSRALSESRSKKRFAWSVYQRGDLVSANVLHATSVEEASQIRNLNFRNPIARLPNGVELPMLQAPIAPSPKHVLFLGRVHSIKGIASLIEAWQMLSPKGWRLTIAGPEEDERLGQVIRDAAAREASIELLGPVGDDDKWDLYHSADLFVLPTLSENFGIVIAEALAAGVPVITTTAAPWHELETHRCGWWINTGTAPLIEALRHAMSLSEDERRAMGARGRALVETNYSWDQIAGRMIAVYEWLLGRRSRPDCVYD
jgi:glycosyltransferase involved in cell wall biosynthesis